MLESGRLVGHDAVRDYWLRQFALIEPSVEPQGLLALDRQTVVDVHQVVRDKQGRVLVDQVVQHVYTMRDGLIAAMDVYHEGALASAPRVP
jgi:hypothetical protein